ncbi:DUF932 domain-containing protein [Deinococcus roseus]|uniref:DUF932 domain-containing protein n=1 Tax=Deinococcus roseus TaxID=392414 RepID=A0ABQ2DHD4_9DEIO|nr:DUF932 domain-containing protein [Deinococcus roseus]GGJ55680.1 hypothetical protein GCM10008938_47310 [Deinococcus roseus]
MTATTLNPHQPTVIPFTPAVQALGPLTKTPILTDPLYFPVSEAPIDILGKANPDWKAIIRPDTGKVLSVQRKSYQLIKNDEVFPQFEELMKKSLDTEGMYTQDSICYGGGQSMREYHFPQHKIEVRDGDTVTLRLRAVNSYDGASSFGFMFGGFRLICSNGMVIGTKIKELQFRHTRNAEERALADLEKVLNAYQSTAELWKTWTRRSITDDQVLSIITSMPGTNEKIQALILNQYLQETQELGRTLWALFNALTHWSTHAEFSNRTIHAGNQKAIVLKRENVVARTMGSKPFQTIAM